MLPLLVTPSNLRNALRASKNVHDSLRVIEANMGDDFLQHYNKYVKFLFLGLN